MLQLPLNVQLDDSATFDNFFVADNTQIVNRLQRLTLETESFFYVWGASQTGKTHLAQALCQQAYPRQLSAAYLPLDNPQLNSLVLEGMGMMDLVCIDNLDSVLGDADWELALFNLFNQLKSEHKSLVIFSHGSPRNLPIQLADLKSRLCSMEIYKLEGLDDEQKIELFRNRAINRGLDVAEEVIRYIFSRHSRSLSDLIAILDQLDRSSMVLKRKVTIPLVKQILG